MTAIAAAAAAAAAAVAVGAAVLQDRGGAATATTARPSGAPPLLLDLTLRADREARALDRGVRLYGEGRREEARRVFADLRSLDARVGEAMARWPAGTTGVLVRLSRAHPRRAVVRLNLGFAFFWTGRSDAAVVEWRAARRAEPDSLYAIRADDLLHPDSPRGIPLFVPAFEPPRAVTALAPHSQLRALPAPAPRGGVRETVLSGVALQRVARRRSAEGVFAAAAALAPRDAQAQVAAAVGRFTKERPERAFSKLGPLARRFPRAPTVRFHLGLLLIWIGEVEQAERQLARARALGPRTPIGRQAARFLAGLERARER